MDHAQETGLWRAVGSVEQSVSELEDEVTEIRESMVTRRSFLRWLAVAVAVGFVAGRCAEPPQVRKARVIEAMHVASEPDLVWRHLRHRVAAGERIVWHASVPSALRPADIGSPEPPVPASVTREPEQLELL